MNKPILRTPQDILASLPYLMKRLPPAPCLVALILQEGIGQGATGLPLRGIDDLTPQNSAVEIVDMAHQYGDALMLVGFGTGAEVTPFLEAAVNKALASGLGVPEALRVEEGRYWSLLCSNLECCPPEGRAVDPTDSPLPAEFAVLGIVPAPTPESEEKRCRTALTPYGASAATVQVATAAAQERIDHVRQQGDQALMEYGRTTITRAVQAQKQGAGPTSITELVHLAVLVRDVRVRDHAWVLIVEDMQAHQDLWTKVTRAAGKADRAAPAALTAVAAWCRDDITLARAAVDEALKAHPGYSMAVQIRQALEVGLPGEAWIDYLSRKVSGPQD